MSNKFYKNFLLEHFKNPRNKKSIKNPDFSSDESNPSCGDNIRIMGLIEPDSSISNSSISNSVVKEIYFEGSGCVISQATASILTQECAGKTIGEILDLDKDYVLKLIGLKLGPNRLRCALISLEALHSGIKKFLIKNN